MPIRTLPLVPALSFPGTRPLVLLAVAEPALRAPIRDALGAYARVAETADGRAALEAARTLGPHLVIADGDLPGLDAVALCTSLKADEKTALAPFFLLCEPDDEARRLAGYRAGAYGCLPRPPTPAYLQARVEGALADRERLLRREAELDVRTLGLRADQEASDPFVERLDAVVAASLHDPDLTLKTLAERLSISARQLQRRTSELTGGSVGERIRNARLARGRELLTTGRASVRDVAEAVGFRSSSAFASAFRTAYGVAPSTIALLAKRREHS